MEVECGWGLDKGGEQWCSNTAILDMWQVPSGLVSGDVSYGDCTPQSSMVI